MRNSLRTTMALAVAGLLGLVGLGVPTVLAHGGASGSGWGGRGTVQSVDGSSSPGSCGTAGASGSFTEVLRDGTTESVGVSPTTSFSEPGASAASFADACVGDWSAVQGTASGASLEATKVWISEPAVNGAVESVNGSTGVLSCGGAGASGVFTVQSLGKSTTVWTVEVGTGTVFYRRGTTSPSFADLCVGDWVGAGGALSAADTLTASRVAISTPRVVGKVSAVDGSSSAGSCGGDGAAGSFAVSGRRGGQAFTVEVTSATSFTERGASPASFADVCLGDEVAALGSLSGTTLTADSVTICPGRGMRPAQAPGSRLHKAASREATPDARTTSSNRPDPSWKQSPGQAPDRSFGDGGNGGTAGSGPGKGPGGGGGAPGQGSRPGGR